jgi:hypothetical protein
MSIIPSDGSDVYGRYLFTSLKDSIEEDTQLCVTPDIAALRHNGPIKVFLFDEMKEQSSWLREFGVEMNTDITLYSRGATTKRCFTPYVDQTKSMNEKMHVVVPLQQDWCNLMGEQELDDNFDFNPRPLNGVIAEVSLRGLRLLDEWYCNNMLSSRIKTQCVLPSSLSVDVHMYGYRTTRLFKYDPHAATYKVSGAPKNAASWGGTKNKAWMFNSYEGRSVG